ncbi:MAG TPA: nucleotide-binding domain containing protein, partial [Trebonia sp.]|nr:nucleotide-binding domain containing protein [Trebonia sp.]
ELIAAGTPLTTTELHLDVLDRDDDALAAALAAALESADVTVADAATDADLDRLAAAAALVRPRLGDIVAVDSGPFAAAYCGTLGITARAARSPVLVVVGSPAQTTRLQLEAAKRGTRARIHAAGDQQDAAQLAALAIDAIDGRAPVTGWHVPSPGVHMDRAWAEQVPAWLAEATRQVLAARPVAGLLACGGEVAAAVLDALEARGLDVVTEVQPLVVAGRIIGGPWDRLPVVTKGGLVGDENAITAAIGHLHGMHEALVGTTEAREVLSS